LLLISVTGYFTTSKIWGFSGLMFEAVKTKSSSSCEKTVFVWQQLGLSQQGSASLLSSTDTSVSPQ